LSQEAVLDLNFAPDKNKKITSLMKKADKATTFKRTCGYLSDAELVEYLTMFPNPEKLFKEVPVVRKRRELWNTDASDILANLFNSDEKCYDLFYFCPGQSSNQERLLVTKSKKSEIFCDILQKTSVLINESVNVTEAEVEDTDEVIFCDILKNEPLEAEIEDDYSEITFVENPQNNMDSEDIKDDPLEQALNDILGNDS
jgi:hypothetical protein